MADKPGISKKGSKKLSKELEDKIIKTNRNLKKVEKKITKKLIVKGDTVSMIPAKKKKAVTQDTRVFHGGRFKLEGTSKNPAAAKKRKDTLQKAGEKVRVTKGKGDKRIIWVK